MMKNIKKMFVLLLAVGTASMFQACSDDEASSASFEQVYAETNEADAATITVPVRGSTGGVEFVLGGTATEGEDYEFSGGADGIEITVLNDTDFEDAETVTVRMEGAGAGNTIFELTIYSDCDYDAAEYEEVSFSGIWSATEFYCGLGVTTGSCDFGPYSITMVQDGTNPNRFDFTNFYGSGCDAYVIFDGAAGTVHFPNQSPCGVALTASTGTFNVCDDTLIINLNFDGSDWIYEFTR